jgi:transposase-like protein
MARRALDALEPVGQPGVVFESPRDCRRLQLRRGWGHDETTATVFPGISRMGKPPRARASGDPRIAVAAIKSIAAKLGCSAESLRSWIRRTEVDSGERSGLTTGTGSPSSSARTWNRGARTISCATPRRFSRRRSSTADRGNGRVHRRPPGRLRSRADLCGAADRSVDLLPTPCTGGRPHQANDPSRIASAHDGCGAATRVAPVGVLYASDCLEALVTGAYEASISTHGGSLAIAGAAATAAAVSAALDAASAGEVLELAVAAASLAQRRWPSARPESVFADSVIGRCLLAGIVLDVRATSLPEHSVFGETCRWGSSTAISAGFSAGGSQSAGAPCPFGARCHPPAAPIFALPDPDYFGVESPCFFERIHAANSVARRIPSRPLRS